MKFPTLIRNSILAAAMSLATFGAAHAQTPLRLVVGFPPGATLDLVARLLGEKLHQELQRPVVVENRTGAGGAIANQSLKTAAPDGSTVLLAPVTTFTMYPHSHVDLNYDSFKDFEPVVHVGRFPYAFGIGKDVPAANVQEYVDLVRKDPKYGFFASAGVGSATHFYGLMYAEGNKIEMTHVPYRGTSAVLMAVQGGELPAGFVPQADMARLAVEGVAKIMAIVADERLKNFPDVPTFRELGYPNISDQGQYAMFVPAGTPQDKIDEIAKIIQKALKDEDIQKRFESVSLEPTGYDAQFIKDEMRKGFDTWGPIIRNAGFTGAK